MLREQANMTADGYGEVSNSGHGSESGSSGNNVLYTFQDDLGKHLQTQPQQTAGAPTRGSELSQETVVRNSKATFGRLSGSALYET